MVAVRLDPKVYAQVTAAAEERGVSRSELLRKWIAAGLWRAQYDRKRRQGRVVKREA